MDKTYIPEPTAARFHADTQSIVKGLMGPVGSGKSVACVAELLLKVSEQAPNADGVRKSRCAVVRNTYGELRTTTIKTFQDWISPENCRISSEAPYTGLVHGDLEDGTSYEAEFIFLALDRPDDVHRLLSLELTFAWINEAREVPEQIFRTVLQRTGRYPRKAEAVTTWSGVIMDTNPPDTDHWYYHLAEEACPKTYHFYRQPPALLKIGDEYRPNPAAENIRNLPEGYNYYLKQCDAGADPNFLRVMILGEYGTLRNDRPVFPQFNEQLHVKNDLPVLKYSPLLLMFDFGLTPACLIGQRGDGGQLRILEEVFNDNAGLKQFLDEQLCPLLKTEKYRDLPLAAVCDPAGCQRSQVDATLTPVNEILRHDIKVFPAVTNDFDQRRSAVERLLTRLCANGSPALVIDRKCRRLIKGFISGYHYRRVSGYNDLYRDMPEKNLFSHVHDALQYGALEVSVDSVRKENAEKIRRTVQSVPQSTGGGDWSAFL